MIQLTTHGDVTRVTMSTRRSRMFGYSVSAYVVRGVMIDTGFPRAASEMATLVERLRPRGVVLTHAHEDHAGNAELLTRRGLPVAMAEETRRALAVDDRAGAYRRVVWGVLRPYAAPPAALADDGLRLVHLPGHSADHHAVWDAERGTLFAGDLFLGVKVRVARPGEDPRALATSLRVAAALRPRSLFDAHRGPVRDPVSSLLAKADWLDETIAAIDRRLADGWTSDRAITRAVLGREDWIYAFSRGDLCRVNFVRAVRRGVVRDT